MVTLVIVGEPTNEVAAKAEPQTGTATNVVTGLFQMLNSQTIAATSRRSRHAE